MNKKIKIVMLLLIVLLIISVFCSPSSNAVGELVGEGKDFLNKGNSIDSTINTTKLHETSNYIYNVLLAIGIVIAVIIAMILGTQFMAASADEKAKVKEAILPFLVGCVIVFGAFGIWKMVVNIGNSAENAIAKNPTSRESIVLGTEYGDVKWLYKKI